LKTANDGEDLIGNLFEVELKTTSKCKEAPEEPPTEMTEKVLKLSCHIDNSGNPIDQLWEGMKISLEGQVEKNSPSLGRSAIYDKTSKINKLPQYLYINFVRFYWKQSSASAGAEAQKAKILKNVAYPKLLDIWEFCTDELKASLNEGRKFEEKLREEEDTKALTGKSLGDN